MPHLIVPRGNLGLATARSAGRRSLGLWPSLVLSFLALAAVAWLDLFAVSPQRPAAVVFPATVSADDGLRIVVAAGGLPIRPERSAILDQLVWIAASDDPQFFARVRSLGAWFVVNPSAFGGCLIARRR
jgi:hypothetical protein